MSDAISKHESSVAEHASASASTNERRDPALPSAAHEPRISRIARRAHEIYEARGGQHGKAMEDWLQAEREIDAEIDASRTK